MSINRILVADDEESMRWVLSKALRKKGYSVDLAADGNQALRQVREQSYDLVIVDIKMPGMSGLEFLDKARELRPDLLVVVMTAEASMKNAVEAMKRDYGALVADGRPLADLFVKHNLLNRAKNLLLQLVGLETNDTSLRRQLVMVLIGLGERELALKQLRDMLKRRAIRDDDHFRGRVCFRGDDRAFSPTNRLICGDAECDDHDQQTSENDP